MTSCQVNHRGLTWLIASQLRVFLEARPEKGDYSSPFGSHQGLLNGEYQAFKARGGAFTQLGGWRLCRLHIQFLQARMRAWMSSFLPAPSTIVVFSFSIITFLARPSILSVTFSSLMPRSSLIAWPPVRMAMSYSIALRRSPKPGAFTAATLRPPRSLSTPAWRAPRLPRPRPR